MATSDNAPEHVNEPRFKQGINDDDGSIDDSLSMANMPSGAVAKMSNKSTIITQFILIGQIQIRLVFKKKIFLIQNQIELLRL